MKASDLSRAAFIVERLGEITKSLAELNGVPRQGGVRFGSGVYVEAPASDLAALVATIRKGLEAERAGLQRLAAQISLTL